MAIEDNGCIHDFDPPQGYMARLCSKCGMARDVEMERQRDELSEEMEECHRLLDEYWGLTGDGVAADTLETRLKMLLAEIGDF